MTDTIAKGSGNSRTLKTVPNALTLYPDFSAMMAALIDGTFPIDLGPLNDAGLQVHGTDLGKDTLLADATEASIWGAAANRTVDQALAQLRALVSTAQSTANGKLRAEVGTYDGTVTSDSNGGEKKLTFSFYPHLVIVQPVLQISGNNNSKTGAATAPLVMIRNSIITRIAATRSGAANLDVSIEWSNNSVLWRSGFANAAQMMSIFRYGYLAIG